MMPSTIPFPDVSARANLPAILESEGITIRRGMAFCPFHHNDRTPALSIFQRDGRWGFKCHSCGEHGDALDWISKRDGVSLADAARKIDPSLAKPGDRPSPRNPKPTPPPVAKPSPVPAWHSPAWQLAVDALVVEAEQALWSKIGRDALAWLRGRGLDGNTISRFRLGFLPDEGWTAPAPKADGTIAGIHHERGILFPWLAPGGWYGATGQLDGPRWCGANVRRLMPDVNEPWFGPDKCKALRGSERGRFYPWPDLLPTQPILPALIVEGEIDALLAVQEAGWLVHAGTVGGANQGPHDSALAVLAVCPSWLIATDRDEAGVEAAWSWRERGPHKARRVLIPIGDDLGEYVQAGGDVVAWLTSEVTRDKTS